MQYWYDQGCQILSATSFMMIRFFGRDTTVVSGYCGSAPGQKAEMIGCRDTGLRGILPNILGDAPSSVVLFADVRFRSWRHLL